MSSQKLKTIESMCSRFLWSGNIENRTALKVAWNTICLPKSESGLGLRKFTQWNKVLCLRFIWLLFSNSDSLWSKWHMHHYLSNTIFQAITPKNSDSAIWKSILSPSPLLINSSNAVSTMAMSPLFGMTVGHRQAS